MPIWKIEVIRISNQLDFEIFQWLNSEVKFDFDFLPKFFVGCGLCAKGEVSLVLRPLQISLRPPPSTFWQCRLLHLFLTASGMCEQALSRDTGWTQLTVKAATRSKASWSLPIVPWILAAYLSGSTPLLNPMPCNSIDKYHGLFIFIVSCL